MYLNFKTNNRVNASSVLIIVNIAIVIIIAALSWRTPLETQSCLKLRGTSFQSLPNDTAPLRNAPRRSKAYL